MICVQVTMCARRAIDEEVSAAEGQELLLDAIRSVEQRVRFAVQKQIDRNLQLLNSLLSVLLAKLSLPLLEGNQFFLRCFEKPVARCYC